jgi:nucleotide-binding universal stress UspA family protein
VSPLRKILVPIDFSPCSRAAVRLAAQLAVRFEARIDLLHVWESPSDVWPEAADGVVVAPASPPADEMDDLLDELGRDGVTANAHLEVGTPVQTILRLAPRYDMVVMGTHGRTGLAHLLVGSVAEQVVRRAARPVLTVRAPDARPPLAAHDVV